MNEWISVKDRLPAHDVDVLIRYKGHNDWCGGWFDVGRYYPNHDLWEVPEGTMDPSGITPWMPICNPVKEIGEKVNEWVSVNKKLPKSMRNVIACFADKDGNRFVDYSFYWKEAKTWAHEHGLTVTHWADFPDPPAESELP